MALGRISSDGSVMAGKVQGWPLPVSSCDNIVGYKMTCRTHTWCHQGRTHSTFFICVSFGFTFLQTILTAIFTDWGACSCQLCRTVQWDWSWRRLGFSVMEQVLKERNWDYSVCNQKQSNANEASMPHKLSTARMYSLGFLQALKLWHLIHLMFEYV